MTTFDRLKFRIVKDTGIELTDFVRTYRGKNQSSSGAYSWWAKRVDSGLPIGSESTATELLKRKEKLVIDVDRTNTFVIF